MKKILGGKKRIKLYPPAGNSRGCVCISYITWPFKDGLDPNKMRGHTNAFEVMAMSQSFVKLGFRVEVCDHKDDAYKPPSDCVVAIAIHRHLELWNSLLPKKCIRVLHATGAHWLQWNTSELSRLESVRNRKGVALIPRRHVIPSSAIEVSDHVVVLGNEYTINSFEFAKKPITRIPISSAYEYPWMDDKDFESSKRKFLWVGSYGMVHKGLDLVLDAFSEMSELELTVCGRPEKEEDFYRLYKVLLKNTPNIRFHGWIDMSHPDFMEIARTHATVIYPSSAEGGAGSVIHCMHAGMIPACTREASVDLGDFGELVESGTVDAVREVCRKISRMDSADIESKARNSYEHARQNHTREKFVENYDKFSNSIVKLIL